MANFLSAHTIDHCLETVVSVTAGAMPLRGFAQLRHYGFACVTLLLLASGLTSCHCGKTEGECSPIVNPVVHAHKPPTKKQIDDQVCWAAGAEVLTNGDLEQCVSASDRLAGAGDRSCCDDWDKGRCNVRAWPRLRGHGYSYSLRTKGWPPWTEIKRELAAKRSMALTMIYTCQGQETARHMVTLVGAATVEGQNFVEIYDPGGQGSYQWFRYDGQLQGQNPYREGRAYYAVFKPAGGQVAECNVVDCEDDACKQRICNEDPEQVDPLNGRSEVSSTRSAHERMYESAREAAECAMGIVKALGQQHPQSLGFRNAQDAAAATLVPNAEPRETIYMPPSAATNCAGAPSNCPSCQLFAYEVRGVAVGAVEVGQFGGKWRITRAGGEPVQAEIEAISRRFDKLPPNTPRKILVVPILDRVYVEVRRNGVSGFVATEPTKGIELKRVYSLTALQSALQPDFEPFYKQKKQRVVPPPPPRP